MTKIAKELSNREGALKAAEVIELTDHKRPEKTSRPRRGKNVGPDESDKIKEYLILELASTRFKKAYLKFLAVFAGARTFKCKTQTMIVSKMIV